MSDDDFKFLVLLGIIWIVINIKILKNVVKDRLDKIIDTIMVNNKE